MIQGVEERRCLEGRHSHNSRLLKWEHRWVPCSVATPAPSQWGQRSPPKAGPKAAEHCKFEEELVVVQAARCCS